MELFRAFAQCSVVLLNKVPADLILREVVRTRVCRVRSFFVVVVNVAVCRHDGQPDSNRDVDGRICFVVARSLDWAKVVRIAIVMCVNENL